MRASLVTAIGFVVVGGCNGVLGLDGYRPCDGAECGDASVEDVVKIPETGAIDAEAGTGWCATRPKPATFCEDFDEGPYYAQFDKVDTSVEGQMVVDQAFFESSPNAITCSLPFNAANLAHAFMTKAFSGTWTHVTLSFYFRPDNIPEDQSTNVGATIAIGDGAGGTLSLSWLMAQPDNDTIAQIIETADASTSTFAGSSWITVKGTSEQITLDLDLAKKQYAFGTDGTTRIGGVLEAGWPAKGPVSISVGLVQVSSVNGQPWGVRFDDVSVDLK